MTLTICNTNVLTRHARFSLCTLFAVGVCSSRTTSSANERQSAGRNATRAATGTGTTGSGSATATAAAPAGSKAKASGAGVASENQAAAAAASAVASDFARRNRTGVCAGSSVRIFDEAHRKLPTRAEEERLLEIAPFTPLLPRMVEHISLAGARHLGFAAPEFSPPLFATAIPILRRLYAQDVSHRVVSPSAAAVG